MSETAQPPPVAEPAKQPAPAKETPTLSGAEIKKQNKAEKAARRAQGKQEKHGAGPATIVTIPNSYASDTVNNIRSPLKHRRQSQDYPKQTSRKSLAQQVQSLGVFQPEEFKSQHLPQYLRRRRKKIRQWNSLDIWTDHGR